MELLPVTWTACRCKALFRQRGSLYQECFECWLERHPTPAASLRSPRRRQDTAQTTGTTPDGSPRTSGQVSPSQRSQRFPRPARGRSLGAENS